METATEYQLKLLRWDFFGTLTWSSSTLGSARSREVEAWEFFRIWAREESIPLKRLPVALRWERGEIGDRPHAHFLLMQVRRASLAACFYRMHVWTKILGLGFARIRLYCGASDLAEYLRKDLESASGTSNANRYEIRKFDHADRLCINDAAWRLMCKTAGVEYVPQTRTA